MRIKAEALTETKVYTNESGTLTVVPGEEIVLGKSKFHVERSTWVSSKELTTLKSHHKTQLIGARGGAYELAPVLNAKKEHCGEYVLVSLNTGQLMRKNGNVVHVIELGGIIELLDSKS